MRLKANLHLLRSNDNINSYNTAALLCFSMGVTPHLQPQTEPQELPMTDMTDTEDTEDMNYEEDDKYYVCELMDKRETWLPEDIDEDKAYNYLVEYYGRYDKEEYAERLQDMVKNGITITDIFMHETSSENISHNAEERERGLFRGHYAAMEKEENVIIPKPSKGKKKRARAKRKRINKAKHLLGNLQAEASQATFKALEGLKPTHSQEKLIKSYMRYSNMIYGKYITKEVLTDFIERVMMFVDEYDFVTREMAKYYSFEHRYSSSAQFIINLLKGRLDHLHIQPGEDLHNYINGNGRFEEREQPMSEKMKENIQRFKDILTKPKRR